MTKKNASHKSHYLLTETRAAIHFLREKLCFPQSDHTFDTPAQCNLPNIEKKTPEDLK